MIILSGVLVVVAIALLVAGIVAGNGDSAQVFGLDALVVIYISIAVSMVSLVCLLIGVFLRRRELFGAGASAAKPAKGGKKADRKKKPAPAPVPAAGAKDGKDAKPAPADPADEEIALPAQPVEVPDDAEVFVVRGRKRYHLETCRQLAGRETEELTYVEAREEGFSPCTACMPDTALAARAAVSVPAPPARKGGRAASKGADDSAPAGLSKAAEPAKTAEFPAAGLKPLQTGPAEPEPGRPGSAGRGPLGQGPAETGSPEPEPFTTGPLPSAWPAPGASAAFGGPAQDEPAQDEPAPFRPRHTPPTVTDLPVAGGTAAPAADAAPQSPASESPAPERTPPANTGPEHAAPEHTGPEHTASANTGPADEPAPSAPRPRESGDATPLLVKALEDDEPAAETPTFSAARDEDRRPAEPAHGDEGPQVRILSGTKRYHRVDCALIEDIGDEADDLESLSRAEAKARGCTPCLVCQPDREHARD
ncbi:hypothetical protein [Actinomadura macrotermitis]|uniref:Uncharacterized protein n=1 Tax=Actinomadura macrotermitis TaxID=2585200 RepID=A0A7K0BMA1_9ACTN|nr:hypothetical protein [Actinomadura macrotermitis]MQY02310.1 hypothetical protein [Actinomadura macrotermitis]